MKLRRAAAICWLAAALAAFALADHVSSLPPDHRALEQWRVSGVQGACAPCGAICSDDS